jgi:hypothetical protein
MATPGQSAAHARMSARTVAVSTPAVSLTSSSARAVPGTLLTASPPSMVPRLMVGYSNSSRAVSAPSRGS